MRELAPARDRRDRAGKVRRRINAPVPEEIAFPASISVVRGRWRGGGRELERRRRRRLGTKAGRGFFGIFQYTYAAARCVLHLSLSLSLFLPVFLSSSLSLVLFHIITRPPTLRNRRQDFVFPDRRSRARFRVPARSEGRKFLSPSRRLVRQVGTFDGRSPLQGEAVGGPGEIGARVKAQGASGAEYRRSPKRSVN